MRRSTAKRGLEERRRLADTILRRQRGAALNAKRKQTLFELEQDTPLQQSAPLIFSDEELYIAIRGAVQSIRSSYQNPQQHRLHLRYLRTLLTDSEDPPFSLLSQLEVSDLLLTEISTQTNPKEVQIEALWALAVMVEGDLSSAQVVWSKASSILPFLSGDAGSEFAELASWIFHSLSCSLTSKEQLGDLDIATPLAELFFRCKEAKENDQQLLDAGLTAAWALCSLMSHSVESRKHLTVFPQFASRLTDLLISTHVRILTEAAWLVAYLTASDDDHLEALVKANIVPHLLNVFQMVIKEAKTDSSEAQMLLIPLLRSLGNIALAVPLPQVKELVTVDHGLMMKCLYECLQSSHRGLQKESCICLAKIASVYDASLIEIFIRFQIIDLILYFISKAAFDIKREAAFVLGNLCFSNKEPNVEFLESVLQRDENLISGIVSLMKDLDLDAIAIGLDFTELILKSIPNGPERIEEADGIDALDNLHFGNVPADIQDFAALLVDIYFGEDYGLS